jgi:hypothetical protein
VTILPFPFFPFPTISSPARSPDSVQLVQEISSVRLTRREAEEGSCGSGSRHVTTAGAAGGRQAHSLSTGEIILHCTTLNTGGIISKLHYTTARQKLYLHPQTHGQIIHLIHRVEKGSNLLVLSKFFVASVTSHDGN